MKITREKICGWGASVLIGILMLVFMAFTFMRTIIPALEEGGVLVNFGNVDEASGTFEPRGSGNNSHEEGFSMPEQPAVRTPGRTATQEMITQNTEPSVALENAQKKEEERRRAEEERLRREEAARGQNIRNQVSSGLSAGSGSTTAGTPNGTGNSQGTGFGTGNQGSPQGNSDRGLNTGTGGYGSFSLNGRNLGGEGLPRPTYSIQQEGTIVVNITVNPQGNVIYTAIGRGTTIDEESMRKSALEAAKKAKFNGISGTNNQSGTITYRYKLK